MDAISREIDRWTAHVVAHRFTLENERKAKMGRLDEKLKRAGEVVSRQSAKIEARADALIAREAEIEALTEQSFVPHETVLSEAEKGLDGLARRLTLLSNDPLLASTGSPEVEQTDAGFQGQ